jgi:ribokinase
VQKVLVIGSINMDLTVRTAVFPRLGETLLGEAFATHPGGKGANQAVAAARLGAQVTFIGRVGEDLYGRELTASLARENIDVRHVLATPDAPTGVASIMVCEADNAILVVPGANALLTPSDLEASEAAFEETDVVLVQLETPLVTITRAAELAARHHRPFLLNPAPAQRLPSSLLEQCALITPNEHELEVALGTPEAPWQDLLVRFPGRIVVTRGGDGAYFASADRRLQHQPGFAVTPVDTTGAGDTFNGAVAAFWDLGMAAAVRRGCAAGALKITKPGAQAGMPTLTELNTFLAAHP